MLVRVNISLHENVDVDRFAEQLAAAGIKVSQQLKMLNIVTAEIGENRIEEVLKMPGVRAVEPDRPVMAL
jgi:hypothetical protein